MYLLFRTFIALYYVKQYYILVIQIYHAYIYHKGQAPVVYSNDSFNVIRVLYLKFKTYH